MKKKFLIICILLLVMTSACNKKDIEEESLENHYATNEVADKTEEETENDYYEEETIISIEIDEDDPTNQLILDHNDLKYNVEDDVNVDYITDMDTISIDGKIISFPCSYSHLVSNFGNLSNVTSTKYGEIYNQIDDSITDISYSAYVLPETGEGRIQFLLYSETNEPCKISDMTCKGFIIQGGNIENNKVITIALPGNIHFGSTCSEIKSVFGNDTRGKSYVSEGQHDFMLIYKPDKVKYEYTFTGYDDGLYMIQVKYFR